MCMSVGIMARLDPLPSCYIFTGCVLSKVLLRPSVRAQTVSQKIPFQFLLKYETAKKLDMVAII